jgi:glycosyltransferase involved in cell wall biosynthesis
MRRSIRVALLTTSVAFGGIEKVVLTLFRHVDRDVQLLPIVFVRADSSDSTFLDKLRALGASPRLLHVDESRLKHLSPLRHVADTMSILRQENFDLIHSHGYRADLTALPLSLYFGVPVVSTCHGFTPTNWRLALYTRLDVVALRYFSRVMAVSTRMRDDLVSKGLNPARIDVITNAVEPVCETEIQSARCLLRDRLGIAKNEFVFGFVGRLSEEKGVHHLLDAVTLRAPAAEPWRLLIVGDGPRREELEAVASRSQVASRITFAGFQGDAGPWLSAMDAFVLPSLTEGTPMALLEAMAYRVPVIASAVGGVPAVIADRISGMLVPPADPQALSDVLREVSANEGLRQALSRVAHETVSRQYNVDTWMTKVRAVYEKALERS